MKKRKSTNWEQKAHKEKIFITFLIIAIALLALYLAYDIYASFQTKAETEAEIGSLNNTISSLTQEKNQLILEQEALEQTVTLLNQEKTQLIAEKEDLTSELATLQTTYDTCSAELQTAEDDLETCEAALP